MAGVVVRADILEDKDGKSRGIGTVTFEQSIEAVQAICILLLEFDLVNLVWFKCCSSNAGLCGEVVMLCISISCVTGGSSGGASASPASAGDARDTGMILGSGRPPGGGSSNPVQYSCLENPMDRGA